VHLGSAHSRARPSGPGPWAFLPTADEIGGRRGIPLIADGSPAKSGWATIVGRRGSCLEANPVDGDPDLGRRVAGGSTELGCDGDGGRAEGCTGEGVSRLPLARLVRSASTSELERRYWRGRRDQRSTGDGDRWWPVKRRMRWPVTS
jgi:hypothetical protein